MILKFFTKSCLAACFLVVAPYSSMAQVVPDRTLGTENSTINSINELRGRIEGGAIRGNNLFHSFQEFNVGEGLEVHFANPDGIANIFSRVTGSSASKIFGTLGVDGAANLFLINPNGIVFGENAAIDIGGSFLATTAETLEFKDNRSFRATNPSESPLLTSKIPIGLGFGSNSGEIIVRGVGHQLSFADTSTIENIFSSPIINLEQERLGINVSPENTLALIGNRVKLDGGIITSPSGRIEIGSLESGVVEIDLSSEILTFNYEPTSKFQDITLNDRSLLNVSGNPGGQINVIGKDLFLLANSVIFNSNFGNLSSGNIQVNTSGSINLVGVTSPSSFLDLSVVLPGIVSQSFGKGKGSDIVISANQLNLRDFSSINARTFGAGNGGNINISTNNFTNIVGITPVESIPAISSIFTETSSSGKGGDINLTGKNLLLESGGLILTNTLFEGRGGNINATFDGTIKVTGFFQLNPSSNSFFESNMGTTTTTFGQGGNITINTKSLQLENAGRVNATTSGFGDAGNIVVNASDSIQVSGKNSIARGNELLNLSQITASSQVTDPFLNEIFNLPPVPQGQAGSITLNTNQLTVQNRGLIGVNNQGTANAGNITVNANSLDLNNSGSITASTVSGQGGNIALNSERLSLLNRSQISATAGGTGDGGNITITADTILGLNNSDITANAFKGNGGNITITADSIVGLEARPSLTLESDITADSELGIDGTVTINSPESNAEDDVVVAAREIDFEPYRELFEGSCFDPNRPRRQELVYIGGGVPESPYNFFDEPEPFPMADTPAKKPQNSEQRSNVPPVWQEGDPLIEPNAVQTNPDGRTFLVAVEKREIEEPDICTRNAENLE